MIKIYEDKLNSREEIFSVKEEKYDVSAVVSEIIKDVRSRGDAALFDYTEKFDKVRLESLRVTDDEIDEAFSLVEAEFVEILKKAEKNIREFHEMQKQSGFEINKDGKKIVGQRVIPIEVAGIYVPGGTAAYPSTVLMDAVPASVAGVSRIVMVTPPGRDGKVNPVILAAAKVAGVNEIYKIRSEEHTSELQSQ